MQHSGRCLCGAVRFEYDGPENWMGHCHCESCRRATASAFTSFFGVENGQWQWTGQEPKAYQSSVGVVRRFCANCGTQMSYQTDQRPNEMHFYAATLDHQDHYKPTGHDHFDERVAWISIEDDLKKS